MTYGLVTCILSIWLNHQFKVTERAMERVLLGDYLKDKIRNEVFRQKTKITNLASGISKLKW